MKRSEFRAMVNEMQAGMEGVAKKHGIEFLDFDDYLYFWLEEHVEEIDEDEE